MSPEIQPHGSMPDNILAALINDLLAEVEIPQLLTATPKKTPPSLTPRQRKMITFITERQKNQSAALAPHHCAMHHHTHPTTEPCIACTLELSVDEFTEIRETTAIPNKLSKPTPQLDYSEKAITSIKKAVNAQNDRMIEGIDAPVYCLTHDWYHSATETCIHCQLILPSLWWQKEDMMVAEKKPEPDFTQSAAPTHLFLNPEYSIMPKGTVLTPEELVAKAPALIAASPEKVKVYLKEALLHLSQTSNTFPSHIYHDPGIKAVRVVWFDPKGNASATLIAQSRTEVVPKWEEGVVQPNWSVNSTGYGLALVGSNGRFTTFAEASDAVEETLVRRRGDVVAGPVLDEDENEDEDEYEDEDEDDEEPF
jgi:hypothetical protein